AGELTGLVGRSFREVLDRLVAATERRDPVIADLGRETRDRYFDQPVMQAAREAVYAEMGRHLQALADDPRRTDRRERMAALVACPQPLAPMLTERIVQAPEGIRAALLEVLTARYYRVRRLSPFTSTEAGGWPVLTSDYVHEGATYHLVAGFAELGDLPAVARGMAAHARTRPAGDRVLVDVYAHRGDAEEAPAPEVLREVFEAAGVPERLHRIVVGVTVPERGRGMSAVDLVTLRPDDGGLREDELLRGLHPMMGKRLHLWRMADFELDRLPAAEDIYLFHGRGRQNPRDERLFAIAEVRDLTPVRDDDGRVTGLPELEHMWERAMEGIRRFQAPRPPRRRLQWNRVLLYVWPPIDLAPEDMRAVAERMAPAGADLGVEVVLVRGRLRDGGGWRERVLRFANPTGHGVVVRVDDPPTEPLRELDEHAKKVQQARRRGTVYPYELVRTLASRDDRVGPDMPPGEFVEHDLGEDGRLVPVERPPGRNEAGIVVGLVRSFTDRYPEGMTRVILLGDPTRALGALAEPECRRINAALDLAEELGVPAEWFALSAGAKIAMDSGTENMDWIAAVLRRIIEFTQRGHELNVVVAGINVGAQPYWNAEATMLMHTKGILVMTPDSAMVLTGKHSLDYAGGVSAEDNFGIGGYDRIMGPNGQAQYWAPDLLAAGELLLNHYEHAYVAPGERWPRPADSTDPRDRDVRTFPHTHPGSDFTTVGDIFSAEVNPERKKAFDIRTVMRAVADQDHPVLERWAGMADADTSVVVDAHLGGHPVTVLGIESRPIPRRGSFPADGPDLWTAGTLFPRSSKKTARAINAASGNRPLVVMANLSGFDGSPESLRQLQLEYGAEIGRAIVNFDGPIVFCLISRYHGGAFVVFSGVLNDNMQVLAVEGSYASVLGGAPAAAVVFTREVDKRTSADARVRELTSAVAAAEGVEQAHLRVELATLTAAVRSEKLGEVAAEFEAVHDIERARRVGSVHDIIPAAELRPRLIAAVERGMERATAAAPG
ncbi:MAG TPA: carboxyl transferase domain-containing protein, partial [Blastococcus sp.]|nr:carboxyl transferase domain-containing protein [Blastococcus sp.]